MIYIATITSKRQLTIPSSLFKRAKLSKGDKIIIREESGELKLKKVSSLVNELKGSISIPKHLRKVDFDNAIERAKSKRFGK